MNKISILLLISFFLFTFSKCKKDPGVIPPEEYGTLTLEFENTVEGQKISLGSMTNTSPSNILYQVDLLKYYITNVSLHKVGGDFINLGNYNLINEEDPQNHSFKLMHVPNGMYDQVRFKMGVDSARNHTGAQDGDLDPAKGMIWSWNTGYVFFKVEGKYKNTSTANADPLILHIGGDNYLNTISIPVTPFEIKGNTRTVFYEFNLNEAFKNPHAVNFNIDNNHQSSPSDSVFTAKISANMLDAFSIKKIE